MVKYLCKNWEVKEGRWGYFMGGYGIVPYDANVTHTDQQHAFMCVVLWILIMHVIIHLFLHY